MQFYSKFLLICKKHAANRVSPSYDIWKGEAKLPFPNLMVPKEIVL